MNQLSDTRVSCAIERPRQASLRRLDWRFLLPDPPAGTFQNLRLVGGDPALAELAVAAKLARQVTDGLTERLGPGAEPKSVDAVAVLAEGRTRQLPRLEQAVAGLQPGGIVYLEVARRSLGSLQWTPNTIRRRLAKAGLTLTGLYWAAPNFEQCRRYIPLDVPGALRWYLSSLFVAGTPVYGLAETLLGFAVDGAEEKSSLLAKLGFSGFLRLVPCLCVTAVAGGEREAANLPAPSVLGLPEIRRLLPQSSFRPLILTSGQDDASRLVILPFAVPSTSLSTLPATQAARRSLGRASPEYAGAVPMAVIKVATDPRFNRETELEHTLLQIVRARLDASMRQSIPKAMGSFCYGDLAVGVEQVALGRSLWVSSGAWRARRAEKITDVVLGVQWLTEFHRQTEVERVRWDEGAIERWIDAPLAAYSQARAAGDQMTESEQQLFEVCQEYARSLRDLTLPLSWQHYDFAPWNIYRAGMRLAVIDWEANRDWETAQPGPGLCDVLYFVTQWNHIAHHLYTEAAELDGLHALFLCPTGRTRTIGAARKAIACYMATREIDRRFLPLLLVYTWVEQVAYNHARARKLASGGGANRASEKFIRYVQTLAEHRGLLFSATHVDTLLG